MQLAAKSLLDQLDQELVAVRARINTRPTLALIWVGDDKPTEKFVNAKQKKAVALECDFLLHHFERASFRQLEAMIEGLNNNSEITGIVLQLPLPAEIDADRLISQIDPKKDIDGLTPNSPYQCPTPSGIVALLEANKINPADKKTVIIGAGRLVGLPLAKIFHQKGWPYQLIASEAEKHIEEIRSADILIACTGVENLVTPKMIHDKMIVIDGSSVDVDVKVIEPLVAAITPARGAIGPLTVAYLFKNLLEAAG
ncbi:MAG TPA: bifunctional 5,10-methylenetetrahydrofolate dehydrogenase/5,10-methenyltetrahydrofolate cyclohydrolase [Candidatus Saccharimonadales bacterium]|nr:bifunctional 5,10-methylenetetrahydrofolate dehydrogenase/5,10-methenyltetrahydrofolate cyclohydrolase [Candidatus Saccharimonadales bacterium]